MEKEPHPQLKKISEAEWKNITLRLFRYAKQKCYGLPRHVEPHDIALEALNHCLSGQRPWNTEAYPDVFDFLAGLVDNLLFNLRRRKETKRFTTDEKALEIADKAVSEAMYLEEQREDADHDQYLTDRMNEIQEVAQGDDTLEDFYLALLDGCISVKEITAYLEWTPSKTYKVKQKLSDKLSEHRAAKVASHD